MAGLLGMACLGTPAGIEEWPAEFSICPGAAGRFIGMLAELGIPEFFGRYFSSCGANFAISPASSSPPTSTIEDLKTFATILTCKSL